MQYATLALSHFCCPCPSYRITAFLRKLFALCIYLQLYNLCSRWKNAVVLHGASLLLRLLNIWKIIYSSVSKPVAMIEVVLIFDNSVVVCPAPFLVLPNSSDLHVKSGYPLGMWPTYRMVKLYSLCFSNIVIFFFFLIGWMWSHPLPRPKLSCEITISVICNM